MIRTHWYKKWSEYVPGTDELRMDVLLTMQEVYEESLTATIGTHQNLVRRLGKFGCLNRSQVASLIGRSRQDVGRLVKQHRIDFKDHASVRARLDERALGSMIEIVTRLTGDDTVPEYLLLNAQTGTDKSIISLLTGVPVHTLRTVRSFIENQPIVESASD